MLVPAAIISLRDSPLHPHTSVRVREFKFTISGGTSIGNLLLRGGAESCI